MPATFFTEAERERRGRFPLEVSDGDLASYFVLTPADLAFAGRYRGENNRLGAAVQLIAVRFLGFCPRDLATMPREALAFVAAQLGVNPGALPGYGARAQTRTEHLAAVRQHLGWRSPSAEDLDDLAEWLVERALEHDKPSLLFTLSAQRLRSRRVTRPAVTTLERLVASARRQAHVETSRRLTSLLTDDATNMLDGLLEREGDTSRTPLVWLRQGATTNSPAAILDAADKLTYLEQRGIDGWDLDALPPNRRKHLARRGGRSSAEALRRVPSERRYPILACFAHQSLQDITDETVDLFDRCVAQTEAKARRQLEEFRRRTARARNEKLQLLLKIGRLVLDPNLPDDRLRRRIYDIMPAAALGAAMDDTERLVGAKGTDHLAFLLARYPYVRRFAPRLLEALDLHTTRDGESLMAAIEFLRDLNADGRRKITAQLDPPLDFVPRRWRPFVVDGSGNIDRRAYEMCALWELRGALRAGHVWLPAGRRYADPESYLISRQDWPAQRSEVCTALDVPADGAARLRERRSQLEELLERLDGILPRGPSLRLEAGGLVLSPLAGEGMPPSAEHLSQAVGERLPRVELPSLLVEVDGWTGFSRHLTHAGGQDSRVPNLATYLYASVLAQACNLGLAEMARIADVSERRLRWCTNWYIREETLRPGIAGIVNCQHREPLARHWGGGTLSSSDGQRFPVAVKSRHARALPRYFGYGTGLAFYTWTSDQFSQYGSKVIPATVRDATYVLDEILDNETELRILEHTTDTLGYTDIVFALFDLLGLQFAPRIRDIGDQRLWRLDSSIRYRHLDPLLHGPLNVERMVGHWDDMLRLAGSLKLGWVSASLLMSRLQAYPRQNELAAALREYGRLVKTIFILRYLQSEQRRHRIAIQLNKGEQMHSLRRFLFFANEGKIRRAHADEQANQASCLNLITNAVITWNTVYIDAVLKALLREGHSVQEDDIPHLAPVRFAHINRYGKYRFTAAERFARDRLRPLQPPKHQP